ncbi:MAG: hypothetical protein JSS27_13755 [Planctomycetes bacterium]|nr:hypothetical protein [Planctomycetota bacterium]
MESQLAAQSALLATIGTIITTSIVWIALYRLRNLSWYPKAWYAFALVLGSWGLLALAEAPEWSVLTPGVGGPWADLDWLIWSLVLFPALPAFLVSLWLRPSPFRLRWWHSFACWPIAYAVYSILFPPFIDVEGMRIRPWWQVLSALHASWFTILVVVHISLASIVLLASRRRTNSIIYENIWLRLFIITSAVAFYALANAPRHVFLVPGAVAPPLIVWPLLFGLVNPIIALLIWLRPRPILFSRWGIAGVAVFCIVVYILYPWTDRLPWWKTHGEGSVYVNPF